MRQPRGDVLALLVLQPLLELLREGLGHDVRAVDDLDGHAGEVGDVRAEGGGCDALDELEEENDLGRG